MTQWGTSPTKFDDVLPIVGRLPLVKEGSGTDIVNGIVAVHVKSTAQNSATRGARVTQPEKQQPTDMSLSKPVQVPADDSMPPPVPFSKPPGNDIQADPKSASSGTITDMIAAAKKRPILCTVMYVPWTNFVHRKAGE